KKVGFAMPLGEWMRAGGPLKGRVDRLCSGASWTRDLLRPGSLRRLGGEHDRGADHTDLLSWLVAFDSWFDTFLTDRIHETILPGASTGRLGQQYSSPESHAVI